MHNLKCSVFCKMHKYPNRATDVMDSNEMKK